VALLAADFHYDQVAPFAGLFIVLLLAVPGKRSPLGAIFGGMSYPLYLNHWIGVFVVHALAKRVGLGGPQATHLFSAVFNIALATGLYLCIDRPLLERRARWYTPTLGRRALIAAYAMIAVGFASGFVLQTAAP